MSSGVEVVVFTDTSMDTHIAIAVSPNITVADFKRELEREHFNCFPGLGMITVNGVKVKKNSCFYHLPESVFIKYFFHGLEGNWFLHAEVRSRCPSENPVIRKDTNSHSKEKKTVKGKQSTHCTAAEIQKVCLGENGPADETENIEKKNSTSESNSESPSESKSVTGIIDRYFTVSNEVSPISSPPKSKATSTLIQSRRRQLSEKKFVARTPRKKVAYRFLQKKISTSSNEKHNSAVVWKRILMASDNLGLPGSNEAPVISVSKHKYGKLYHCNSSLPSRHLVFEFSDTED